MKNLFILATVVLSFNVMAGDNTDYILDKYKTVQACAYEIASEAADEAFKLSGPTDVNYENQDKMINGILKNKALRAVINGHCRTKVDLAE